MRKILIPLISAVFVPFCLTAQIYLNNASFEGMPMDASVPVGWFPCNDRTTPDILPGPWGVFLEASEGETFVGLITREDGSFETIGQRLKEPLKENQCYTFSLDVGHSNTYAGNRYAGPLKLRIYIGPTRGSKAQLIYESDFMGEEEWTKLAVKFNPKQTAYFIRLEAFYEEGPFSYRGNILIDNISAIQKCIRASLE
jgi:hypothetical protein